MKKKLLSLVVSVVMMVSCVCEASAAFVDESAINGEGRIENILTYEDLLNHDEVRVYDVEKQDDDMIIASSPTNGEGRIENILTYEDLLNHDGVRVYDVEKQDNDMIIASSPTNGNGEIKHVIVVDTDLMPLTSRTDYELPANTVIYFEGEWVSDALWTVTYKPTNVSIFYGFGTKKDGTGNHYAYQATGGAGGTSVSLPSREWLYPYLANGNNKTVYVDFVYTITVDLRMQNKNLDASAVDDVIGTMVEEKPLAMTVGDGEASQGMIIDGDPGDIIIVGDIVFEIVTREEVEAVASEPVPHGSTSRWKDVSLSGDSMSKKIEVTKEYPYAKVWISNEGKGDIKFTITRGSDTGKLVTGTDVTIKAGKSTSVYSTNAWPADDYYANYTCGKSDMAGTTACRVASTIHELDL